MFWKISTAILLVVSLVLGGLLLMEKSQNNGAKTAQQPMFPFQPDDDVPASLLPQTYNISDDDMADIAEQVNEAAEEIRQQTQQGAQVVEDVISTATTVLNEISPTVGTMADDVAKSIAAIEKDLPKLQKMLEELQERVQKSLQEHVEGAEFSNDGEDKAQ